MAGRSVWIGKELFTHASTEKDWEVICLPEMWTPNYTDGIVEKKVRFPAQLLDSMQLAATERGMSDEDYIISSVRETLKRREIRPR